MGNPDFIFKQFAIRQDRCAMKVGTDGVLLGAWADMTGCRKILDIGTGTGLIAIMAAQRCPDVRITGIEIDRDAAEQASQNASDSPWGDRISIINADIRQFHSDDTYDAILSNPPYFSRALHSPDGGRNSARHDDSLSFPELTNASARLLSPQGVLHVIIPSESVPAFTGAAATSGLQLHRISQVITRCGKAPKRTMLSFGKYFSEVISEELAIAGDDGNETREYVRLVKDFYLKY